VLKRRPLDLEDAADCARWDRFCLASEDAWFWHTTDWLRYQRAYRPLLASRDRSFVVEEGAEVVAICPLLEETLGPGQVELGAGGSPAPAPAFLPTLDPGRRRDVARTVFAAVDLIAAECNAVRAGFRLSPLSPGFRRRAALGNPLVEWGYLDVSLRTQVIDLEVPEEDLWAAVRKGHRSDVRRAERTMQVEVFDGGRGGEAAFAAYRALHAKAAGRVTRPARTFELMGEWMRRGDAVLIAAETGDGLVSVALVILYNSAAYYASGANDPDAEGPGIAHLVQWRTIQALRARGIRRYEIGWQQQVPVPHDVASAKERSISSFKHGFGGTTEPLFTGERFYSASFYREVTARRGDAFAAEIETRSRG
jgi:Acetyltransferase (GNAT) domain